MTNKNSGKDHLTPVKETWNSTIDNLKEDNLYLQKKLTETIKSTLYENKLLLDKLELYQQLLLDENDRLNILRNEINGESHFSDIHTLKWNEVLLTAELRCRDLFTKLNMFLNDLAYKY